LKGYKPSCDDALEICGYQKGFSAMKKERTISDAISF